MCNQLARTRIPNTDRFDLDVRYFGQFVRHLMIGGKATYDWIGLFLEACPNLIDLALWTSIPTKDFLPLFSNLKLQRLSVNLSTLDESDFRSPALSYITHLDVTVFGEDLERWKMFAYLPVLTHLAINNAVDREIVQYLLRHCATLRILLLICNKSMLQIPKLTGAGISDSRFVMMDIQRFTVEDWENGTNGKEDMWACAEGISAAKHRMFVVLLLKLDNRMIFGV